MATDTVLRHGRINNGFVNSFTTMFVTYDQPISGALVDCKITISIVGIQRTGQAEIVLDA